MGNRHHARAGVAGDRTIFATPIDSGWTPGMSGSIYWFICVRAAYPPVVPTVAASQGDFNRRTANAIGGIMKSRHEVGDLLARPIATPIRDHILCDGSAIPRLSYPQLFAAIGTEWGAGDGTTTFNIPNLIATALPTATTAPPQVVTDTTVSNDPVVVEPTQPGQTGGSITVERPTGGRPRRLGQHEV